MAFIAHKMLSYDLHLRENFFVKKLGRKEKKKVVAYKT